MQDLSAASERLEEQVMCVGSYLDLVKMKLKQAGRSTEPHTNADPRASVAGRVAAAEGLSRVAVHLKDVLANIEDSIL
ncbi:hypothetical protein WJX73_000848 [Symbiochloris irregularis]|uniref:Uncharacterized protein n=1 Tax=Symbiochloris irregularis TaxID=706552 RepID=A0AAW1PIJ3_9CHLO